MEIAPDNELSILNRHLDELIYFFEATEYNVLIIEDLERFNDPEIFTHLRELNSLINNSKQVNRKITFIYALKDDVFKDEKRTKFFDYIIPVIPVIDNKNSREKLSSRLSEMGLANNEIPSEFISDISFYIGDMRLLINTLNEFDLYRNRLQGSTESYVRLLAMMVFKNKYPDLFAKLQRRKGLAYQILHGKETFISLLSVHLEEQKAALEENIKRNGQIFLKNVQELRAVYIYKLISKLPDNVSEIATNSKNINLKDLDKDENIELLVAEKTIRYVRNTGGNSNANITFSTIETEVDATLGYKKREDDIKIKYELRTGQLETELQDVQRSIDKLRQYNLQDIFAHRSLDKLDPVLAKNGLLTYLVTNGYITEDYNYYLSYFYPGSLTRQDMDFFFSVKEKKDLPFDYQLEKIGELLKRFQLRDFSTVNILNNNLVDHLLYDRDHPDKLDQLILVIANNNPKSVSFIQQYLRIGKQPGKFIELLGNKWDKLWAWVKVEANLPPDQQLQYLRLILENCNINDMKILDQKHLLSDEIELMADFINWASETIDNDRIIRIIEELNLYFKNLDDIDPKGNIFDFIYRYNHFDINSHMISFILRLKSKNVLSEQLNKANLSTILKADLPELVSYINNNLSYYIEHVFMKLPENTQEDEAAVLLLINNEQLSKEEKQQVLQKTEIRLTDISKVNQDIRPEVLQNSRMEGSWFNIYTIFKEADQLTPELITYLNMPENYEELSKSVISDDNGITSEEFEPLGKAIMFNKTITAASLDHLLNSYNELYFDEANLQDLTREHVKLILEHDRLYMEVSIYEQIQQHHNGLQIIYIENDIDAFFEKIDELTLNATDYKLLFDSDKIVDDLRKMLIERMDIVLLDTDNGLANSLGKLLERTGFMEEIDINLLSGVFAHSNDVKLKERLLLKYLNRLSEHETGPLLSAIGGKFKEIADYKNPKIEESLETGRLLYALRDKRYFVTKADPKDGKIQIYTKTRPK